MVWYHLLLLSIHSRPSPTTQHSAVEGVLYSISLILRDCPIWLNMVDSSHSLILTSMKFRFCSPWKYSYGRLGVKNWYLWFSHFSGETKKNWITFAQSVLYCWKSDRIIFSNIQIHCYWCFELPIKISRSLWRVSIALRHFEHIFVVNNSSYDILIIFFMAKHGILVKWAPK